LLRNANLVENYPGFPGGIPGVELVRLFETQFRSLALEVTCAEVLAVHHQAGAVRAFLVQTNQGSYRAPVIVLASGTKPRPMTSPVTPAGVKDKIFYEIHALTGMEGKEIAILGAGDAAFDYALNLARKNQVSILNRGEELRCLPLLWDRARAQPAIRYYENTAVTQIEAEGLERLRIACRKPGGSLTIYPHYLVPAFGRDPQLDYLTEEVKSIAPQLESEGRLYLIGDVANGIYRQTSIAVGNGVQAAMKIYQTLKELSV
jgi:thioredoxin reductase